MTAITGFTSHEGWRYGLPVQSALFKLHETDRILLLSSLMWRLPCQSMEDQLFYGVAQSTLSRQRQVMFLNNVRLHSFFNIFNISTNQWTCYLSVNFTCGEAWCTATLLCWFTSFLLINSMSLNRVARRVSFQKQLSGGSEHFWIVMSLGCLKTRDRPLRPNTLQWFWYEIHWCLRPLVWDTRSEVLHSKESIFQQFNHQFAVVFSTLPVPVLAASFHVLFLGISLAPACSQCHSANLPAGTGRLQIAWKHASWCLGESILYCNRHQPHVLK